jgi:hypothetical protein
MQQESAEQQGTVIEQLTGNQWQKKPLPFGRMLSLAREYCDT